MNFRKRVKFVEIDRDLTLVSKKLRGEKRRTEAAAAGKKEKGSGGADENLLRRLQCLLPGESSRLVPFPSPC
jgi:hypothetical protein